MKGKPKMESITFEYTAVSLPGTKKEPNEKWNHKQGGWPRFKVPDFPAVADKISLKLFGKTAQAFSSSVKANLDGGKWLYKNDQFTLDMASNTNKKIKKFPAIVGIRATIPQQKPAKPGQFKINILASCKLPIRLKDEFGPFKVVKFKTSHRECSIDSSDRSELIPVANSVLKVAAPSANQANANQGSESSTGNDSSTAAITLGVVGAAVAIIVVVGVTLYFRSAKMDVENDHQTQNQPGVFEVDLDSRQVRRVNDEEATSSETDGN
jgi:hypothetical protein